jgi:hydrogenase maturation protease
MDVKQVDRIVNAVLYEGYMLYPYRPSAVKNQRRWNFGVLYPESYSEAQSGNDASSMQTECLLLGNGEAELDIKVRFLHLLGRQAGKPIADSKEYKVVDSLEVDGQVFQTWQEAVERDVDVSGVSPSEISLDPRRVEFTFPSSRTIELLHDGNGQAAGALIRKQEAIEGSIVLRATRQPHDPRLFKVAIRISNRTAFEDTTGKSRDQALMRSFVSTHTVLSVRGGEFVSLLDPPASLREAAAQCRNVGTWPVMVGREGERDAMLSSPIILYDYPRVAPESAGDFFDGTEIDEMLALRVMTLTDEEKREMQNADERTRRILERTDTLPAEQMMKLHGAMRGLRQLKEEKR